MTANPTCLRAANLLSDDHALVQEKNPLRRSAQKVPWTAVWEINEFASIATDRVVLPRPFCSTDNKYYVNQ